MKRYAISILAIQVEQKEPNSQIRGVSQMFTCTAVSDTAVSEDAAYQRGIKEAFVEFPHRSGYQSHTVDVLEI